MRNFHSLVLLSVGGLALSFCPVAAHADSIPTLTATSVSFRSNYHEVNQWTISGDSFSLGGGGEALIKPGAATPGQSLADDYDYLPLDFATTFGPGSSATTGTVTLDGVTHNVELLDNPHFVFPPNSIYDPSVTGTFPGGISTVATAPAIIVGDPNNFYDPNKNQPIALQENFCSVDTIQPSCLGNVLANVYIDVPGTATLYGSRRPGDNFDYIDSVVFTTTPEPVSLGLAAIGLAAMLLLLAFRKRRLAMRHLRLLFLMSAGSIALFLCSTAARADSIPTLTATSVSYSHRYGVNRWSIDGSSFSVGGAGAATGVTGPATVGQSLADAYLFLPFSETIGAPGYTTGFVTLDGVTHYVEMLNIPQLVFQPDFIYHPTVIGPEPNPGPNIGAIDTVATGPAVVTNNNQLSQLQEIFCQLPAGSQSCLGNYLANVYTDVPGIATVYGYRNPGDNYDTITNVFFTTTPEPVSYGLTAAGITAMLGFMAFRRRRQIAPHDKIEHDLRRAAGISL